MNVMKLRLPLWFRITPMSGLMVALSLIVSLVFVLLVLGSLLTNLIFAGAVVGGVMLTVFVLMMVFRLVGVFAVFLGLFNLFRGLK